MEEYESKAVTTKIQATSRMSLKVRENFFTIEWTEERSIPNIDGVDIEKERKALCDTCNNEVENQADIIYNTFVKGNENK